MSDLRFRRCDSIENINSIYFRKVPVELCGPAACGLVAGPTECYEKKVSSIYMKEKMWVFDLRICFFSCEGAAQHVHLCLSLSVRFKTEFLPVYTSF